MRIDRSLAVAGVSGLFALIASTPFARAATADEASAVLARIQKAYAASPSFTASFVQTYTPAGFGATAPETGRVVFATPDRIRFEYDGKDGKLFTFDGRTARQYVAADRQVVVKTLSAAERTRLPLVFFESPASLLARYDAATHALDNGLVDVTLTPKGAGDPKSLALAVGTAGDVKRLVVKDAGDNLTTFTFTNLTPGKARPAADFAPPVPPGARVLNSPGGPP